MMFGAAVLTNSGAASAAPTTIPFQINPAPYGNPNGSFDAFAAHCAVEIGDRPGVVAVIGAERGRWGCTNQAPVQWVNISTGRTGATLMSNGLNGIPAAATLETGVGQVLILVNPGSTTTPGFTSVYVP